MVWFDNCVVFLVCIIEVFLLFDYFHNFFEIKIRKKYVKFVFMAACVLLFGINILGNANINLCFFPLLMWIFVSILFENRIEVRLGYFITAYVVMVGVEFLFAILSKVTAGIVLRSGVIPMEEYGWQSILAKLLNFIIFLILKQTSGRSRSRITNKLFLTYLCIPISTLGAMLAMFYSGIDIRGSLLLRIIMTLFFICMMLGNIVLFYSFQRYTENLSETAKQQIELQYKNAEIERLSKIIEMNEVYNETVHNLSHSLKVIDQLAVENDVERIRTVVEELTGNLSLREVSEYSNHKMLNTILSEYAAKAKKNRVVFDVYVEPGCVLKHIEDIDLVSMLGNLFDNSIEAASKADNPSIVTRIFMHKSGKMCMIKVVNDYEGNIKIINDKVVSTKEEGIHGIGLASVLKTAEKYNGSFSYYTEEQKFTAVLILPIG